MFTFPSTQIAEAGALSRCSSQPVRQECCKALSNRTSTMLQHACTTRSTGHCHTRASSSRTNRMLWCACTGLPSPDPTLAVDSWINRVPPCTHAGTGCSIWILLCWFSQSTLVRMHWAAQPGPCSCYGQPEQQGTTPLGPTGHSSA